MGYSIDITYTHFIYWSLLGGFLTLNIKEIIRWRKAQTSKDSELNYNLKILLCTSGILCLFFIIAYIPILFSHNDLFRAIEDRDYAKVEAIFKSGVDINVRERETKDTPLSYAAYYRDKKMVKLILEHGGNPNICEASSIGPPLFAIYRTYKITPECFEITESLLKCGAKPNLSWYGKTPLHYAFGDKAMMELLIKYKANINALDGCGENLLSSCLQSRGSNELKERLEMIEFLTARGINVNYSYSTTGAKSTVLDKAFGLKSKPEIIELLRKKGAKTAEEIESEKPKSESLSAQNSLQIILMH